MTMKAKSAIVVLIVVSLLLGVSLMRTQKEATEQKNTLNQKIDNLSNEVVDTKKKLVEQQNVNTTLETNLSVMTKEAQTLSNNLARTSTDLERTASDLAKTSAALKDSEAKVKSNEQEINQLEAQIKQRDTQIAQLETNRDQLNKKMDSLNINIKDLEASISETQRKLTASEGDREFLLKELKRLQAEKAQLEKQMSDLAFLREQVKQLKDELSLKRRLDWIRRGLYGDVKKPGQLMQEGFKSYETKTNNFNLEVEVNRDGTIKVKPTGTNAPPATPNPK